MIEENKDISTDSENIVGNNNSSVGNNDLVWRRGYIQGNTFSNKEIQYRTHKGRAIFEGDIIIAETPKEMERLSHKVVKAVGRKGDKFRWLRAEISYVIQSTLPNQNRVSDAIKHWEENTPIRFIQRTDNNSRYYPNYVSFKQYVPSRQELENQEEIFHCSSPLGMQGRGEQSIIISDECIAGDVIHEIGHTVGLWHEQSREDRDKYVKILWENVRDGKQSDGTYDPTKDATHNFDQHITDGDQIGSYDYCSIMHYGAWFWSKNGQPTIDIKQKNLECGDNQKIGQKNGLSKGDKAAVIQMYGILACTVIRNSDGRLEAFLINQDGQIFHKLQAAPNSVPESKPGNASTTGWDQDWSAIGLQVSVGGRPVILKNADGSMDVFSTGGGYLYHYTKQGPNNLWTESIINEDVVLPASREGNIEVARHYADGRLESFWVHHFDFQLHHNWQSESNRQWNISTNLGGLLSPNRRPVIAENADGRLQVFIVDLNNQLYHRWQTTPNNSSQWSNGWDPLGGPLASDPVVARNFDGRLELFKVDADDNQLYHRWQIKPNSIPETKPDGTYTSGWSDSWSPIGGYWSPRARPVIAQNADGRLELFMTGTDGRLYHTWQIKPSSSNEWFTSWALIGKPDSLTANQQWPISSIPIVAQNADGRLDVFMMDSIGKLYHTWQKSPNSINEWYDRWYDLNGVF
jgi:hypothetical protein